MDKIEELRVEVKKLLDNDKVEYVIGYSQTKDTTISPIFIKDQADVDKLVWNPLCINNLAKFIQDYKKINAKKPLGIIVKGCDSRAVSVLLQEKFIARNQLHIIGLCCEQRGMVDLKKLTKEFNSAQNIEFGEKGMFKATVNNENIQIKCKDYWQDKCKDCHTPYPVVCDTIIGVKEQREVEEEYKDVNEIENSAPEERWNFWHKQFEKCIRCYACRSVCPMCYCNECAVDTTNFAIDATTSAKEKADKIKWIERSSSLSENTFYHYVRAIHLAGRCVDCGECDRVCPVNIPLRLLNKKMEKEAKELFDYKVGYDHEQPTLFSCFCDNDPEDFIR